MKSANITDLMVLIIPIVVMWIILKIYTYKQKQEWGLIMFRIFGSIFLAHHTSMCVNSWIGNNR